MTGDDFKRLLDQTWEDHHLSRGEKQAMSQVVDDVGDDVSMLAHFRKLAFAKARNEAPNDARFAQLLAWLEGVVKVLTPLPGRDEEDMAEAWFSPAPGCVERLQSFLRSARRALDICVFTITDDRVTAAIVEAFQKGVKVRILTDDEKSEDRGSDIDDLARLGVPVRTDRSEFHMHHKFALADGRRLLTGSYNWTRSASLRNEENFVIVADPRLVAKFEEQFEALWEDFA